MLFGWFLRKLRERFAFYYYRSVAGKGWPVCILSSLTYVYPLFLISLLTIIPVLFVFGYYKARLFCARSPLLCSSSYILLTLSLPILGFVYCFFQAFIMPHGLTVMVVDSPCSGDGVLALDFSNHVRFLIKPQKKLWVVTSRDSF